MNPDRDRPSPFPETAVRVAIHRLRQRYAPALREAVADTLSDGEDVERERGCLKADFG